MKNLILIENSLKDIDIFKNGINDNTILSNETEILNIDFTNINHIGFVYHYKGYPEFPFFKDILKKNSGTPTSTHTLPQTNIFSDKFKQILKKITETNPKIIIDLLTCNVFNQKMIDEINLLSNTLDITIRYSIDEKGSYPHGNWIQESHNIDIKDIYFNDLIINWNYNLNNGVGLENLTDYFFTLPGAGSNYFYLKNNFSWPPAGFNSTDFIQLFPGQTLDGNGYILTFGSDYEGIVATNHVNLTSESEMVDIPIIRNLGTTWDTMVNGSGGIVRKEQQFFSISKCYSDGIITDRSGGISGENCGHDGLIIISDCYSTGGKTMIASGNLGEEAGGIVGRYTCSSINTSANMTILNCYSTASPVARGSGGICGSLVCSSSSSNTQVQTNVHIQECFSLGHQIGDSNDLPNYSYCGGICGSECSYTSIISAKTELSISNCYTIGNIENRSGGIVGGMTCWGQGLSGCVIENCYALGNVSNESGSIAGYNLSYKEFTPIHYAIIRFCVGKNPYYTLQFSDPTRYEITLTDSINDVSQLTIGTFIFSPEALLNNRWEFPIGNYPYLTGYSHNWNNYTSYDSTPSLQITSVPEQDLEITPPGLYVLYENIPSQSYIKPCYTSIYLYINDDLSKKYKVGLVMSPNPTDSTSFIIYSKEEFIHVFKSYEPYDPNEINENINIYKYKVEIWEFVQNFIMGTYTFNGNVYIKTPGTGVNMGIRLPELNNPLLIGIQFVDSNEPFTPLTSYQQIVQLPGGPEVKINLEFEIDHLLKSFNEKNYVFTIGSNYFIKLLTNNYVSNNDTNIDPIEDTEKTLINYSHPVDSMKRLNEMFQKNIYSFYNINNNPVNQLFSPGDFATFRHLGDDIIDRSVTIDPIPYYNSEKSFYFQYLQTENFQSTINIILPIPQELLTNGDNPDCPYYLDTSNINSVVLFNYNNIKIGPMTWSSTHNYYYTTITEESPVGITDFTPFKLSFVFQFVNKEGPIMINSPSLIMPPPVPETGDLSNSSNYSDIFENIVENSTYNLNEELSTNNNIILNFFNESLYSKINNEIAKLYDIYLKFTFKSKIYYIFVETLNLTEFYNSFSNENYIVEPHNLSGVKVSFYNLIKFLPNDVISQLNILLVPGEKYPYGSEITYPINLTSFGNNFKNIRIDLYGKPLNIVNPASTPSIDVGDLDENDFIISKEVINYNDFSFNPQPSENIFSKLFYYNIQISKNEQVIGSGNSFKTNHFIIRKTIQLRRGTQTNYYNLYNIYYTKDLIVNDTVSNLDNNTNYLGNNLIKLTFKTDINTGSDTSISINQEIKSFETTVNSDNLTEFINNNVTTENNNTEPVPAVNDFTQALQQLIEQDSTIQLSVESIQLNDSSSISNLIGANLEEDGSVVINGDAIGIYDLITNNITVASADTIKYTYQNKDGSTIFKIISKNTKQVFTIKAFNKNGVWQSQTIGEGSLIVESKLLIKYLYVYDLDMGQLPGNEINEINYNNNGFRIYSENNITATAILLNDFEKLENEDEDDQINLNIYEEVGNIKTYYFLDISEYVEDTFNVLQPGNIYRIFINQENKDEIYFDILYQVMGKEYNVNEGLINEPLGINFNDTLKINSYLHYWYNLTGTMDNLLIFLQNNYRVVSSENDIIYNDNSIGELQFIFTNNNSVTFTNELYSDITFSINELYDTTKVFTHNFYNIEIKGLGKNGSGIVQLTLLSPSVIPCVTFDTLIKTPSGEKYICDLEEGELVKTSNGENVPIIKKMVKKCINPKKMPFIIPKNYYGKNMPNRDLYISGNHAINIGNNTWRYPQMENFDRLNKKEIIYYNLKLPDYHKHQFIANNLVIESWNDEDTNIQNYKWITKGNNIIKILL
ncbi:hypothetical protein crov142 [Cafeteria roenbergensis virus]|uniref:Hedgehog/Intein (Hint) domain-containing protein n=1 Tax=Cafeteria roenbergensis virus (strain BV-PW1) TaxID=693272 RepID=E3T4R2_CROVB|nr:hypothetical protein crov142 [Cafeteria roenbergensis virus BV-PW1]ADO67175.1 hypothetical protein crov142 [Cafeteria roenbergensis virus BV-PW1]